MLVNNDHCRLLLCEKTQIRKVRFHTLDCYPLTGALESESETLDDTLLELVNTRQSERQSRKIDTDSARCMEKKMQEGHF